MKEFPAGPLKSQPELVDIFLNNPFPNLEKWYKEYGDMFTLEIGNLGVERYPTNGKWVFLVSADLMKTVYKTNSSVIMAGPARDILHYNIHSRDGSLLLDGPRHIERRKILGKLIQGEKKIRDFTPTVLRLTQEAIAAFPRDKPFEMTTIFRKLSCDIMTEITFGELDMDEVETINSNISRFGDPSLTREVKKGMMGQCHQALSDLVDTCPYPTGDADNSVCSVLLDSCRFDKQISEADVKGELFTVMLAGVDTTACTMAWIMVQLLKNPPVFEKVMQELNEVFADGGLCAENFDKLPYLEAAIHEVGRISPVIAVGSIRLVMQPLELGEYTLPAGTIIINCQHLIHNREDYYPEPHLFQPERFLNSTPDPYKHVFFGGGIRRCLGMQFALYEMRVVIATMLYECQFEQVNVSDVPELQGSFFAPKGNVTLRLAQP